MLWRAPELRAGCRVSARRRRQRDVEDFTLARGSAMNRMSRIGVVREDDRTVGTRGTGDQRIGHVNRVAALLPLPLVTAGRARRATSRSRCTPCDLAGRLPGAVARRASPPDDFPEPSHAVKTCRAASRSRFTPCEPVGRLPGAVRRSRCPPDELPEASYEGNARRTASRSRLTKQTPVGGGSLTDCRTSRTSGTASVRRCSMARNHPLGARC